MQKPLRIGIEAQRLFRSRKHGMDVYALELIRALQSIDQYNQYYVFAQPGDDEACLPETPNFRVIKASSPAYPTWEQWTLPRLVKGLNLDLVHFTANTASIAGIKNRVITVHDVIYMQTDPHTKGQKGSPYQRFGNLYRKAVVPVVAQKATQVITVSGYQQHEIARELDLPIEKIRVIHNGLSSPFRQEPSEATIRAAREKYQLPDKFFFYLGNTEPRKNLSGVLKAYAQLSQTGNSIPKLVIKGLEEGYLRQKISESGLKFLPGAIRLIPYLNTEELAATYSLATCFLFPSFSEGFGIPIIEAMASGTPVITSNTTSMPEISGGAALTINPADPSQLSMAMYRVLYQHGLASELKEEGKRRASDFSWTEAAYATLAAYESAVYQKTNSPFYANA